MQPEYDPTTVAWVEFCLTLSPKDNLLLIGYLVLNSSSLPPNLSISGPLDTESNWKAAHQWIRGNFRKVLKWYCGRSSEGLSDIAEELAKSAAAGLLDDLKPKLFWAVPVLAGFYSIPIGVSAAIIIFFVKRAKGWCKKYRRREFNGYGKYMRQVPKDSNSGAFNISYDPPIVEFVEDPAAYPVTVVIPKIEVPGVMKGSVKVGTKELAENIARSLKRDKQHSFEFNDARLAKTLTGKIDGVGQDTSDGFFNILVIDGTEVKVTS